MDTSHETSNIRLSSTEIAELFSTFLSDSAGSCVISYFAGTVKDSDIYELVDFALNSAQKELSKIKDIFSTVDHPIPRGFDESDVNINANTLFSENFALEYLKQMTVLGLKNYAEAISVSARNDVHSFFEGCLQSSLELENKVDAVLLSKGLYVRSPYITIPHKIELVKKQSIVNGLFGDKRQLNVQEITQIFINAQTNAIGKALTMGLSQTIKSRRIRDYVLRGMEIAEKHTNILSEMLQKEELSSAKSFDSEVLSSTEEVFSDKLIMFLLGTLNSYGLSRYGMAISKVMRTDVTAAFTRLSMEIAKYAEDGLDIVVDNEWLEEFPEAPDRKALARV